LAAAGRLAAGADPEPAEAASGMTQDESTANTGIRTDRRIRTPLDAGLRRLLSSDC
jgi:hypothetical protein